jgi:hypothetical protein
VTPWGPLAWVAPGVLGVVETMAGALVVHWIEAVTPGAGDVGRWLDHLPPVKTVLFADVVSATLAGMLRRRGFVEVPTNPDHLWRPAR